MLLISTFFIGLIVAVAVIPFLIQLSNRFGWVDQPNNRKIHLFPVSRIGGVGIFFAIFCAIVPSFLLFNFDSFSWKFLCCSAFAFALGLFDDFSDWRPKYKLLFQVLLGAATYFAGFQIQTIHVGLGHSISLGIFSLPITVFWIALIMNAFNMIDGMDGLATSYCFITMIGLSILLMVQGQTILSMIGFATASACLGFYLYNYHPAKIFMGDSGSQFLGYLLAVLSVKAAYGSSQNVAWVPLTFLSYPLMELLLSIIRRTIVQIKKEHKISIKRVIIKTMIADSDHFHHRLLKYGLSQKISNIIIMLFTLLSNLIGFVLIHQSNMMILFGFGLFGFGMVLLLRMLYVEDMWISQERSEMEKEYEIGQKFNPTSIIRKVDSRY